MSEKIVQGAWVDSVLRACIIACPKDEEMQLNVLTRALAFAGKSLGVPVETLVTNLETAYAAEKVSELPKSSYQ